MSVYDLFKQIKSDREISLNNWRYRVLHWFYGVETKDDSVPSFFYTHYCPLFWATNLILLFCIPIFFWKIFYGVVFYSCLTAQYISRKVNGKIQVKHEDYIRNNVKNWERTRIIKWLKQRFDESEYFSDYRTFWLNYPTHYLHESDEVKKIWEAVVPSLKKWSEQQILRDKLMKERAVFWVNFSQIFFKIALVILAVLAVVVLVPSLLFVLFWLGLGVIWIVKFLFTIDWWIWLVRLTYGIISASVLALIVWNIYLFAKKQSWIINYILPPFQIAGAIGSAFAGCGLNMLEGFAEFISMTYSENCPKITIVDEEI